MTQPKIKWKTEIFAPYPYAIELVAGECFWFYDENGPDGLGFYAHANAGWTTGGISINGAVPSGKVALPRGVSLTWLSHTERKYYHIKYELPHKDIIEAFKERFDNEFSKERNTAFYKNINFAFSPGGFVSIRVSGSKVKEIVNIQATEVKIPWEFFAATNHFNPRALTEEEYNSDFINAMPEPYKSEAIQGIFPIDRWQKYSNKKFKWHIATMMDLQGYRQFSVNGDMFFITKSDFDKVDRDMLKPVPTWFKWFYRENGKRYLATVCFSQTSPDSRELPTSNIEIFEAFENFFKSSNHSTALVINKVDDQFIAYLTNGSKKQDLNLYHPMIRELEPQEFLWFI